MAAVGNEATPCATTGPIGTFLIFNAIEHGK